MLHNLNSMCWHSKKPNNPTVKAVYCLDAFIHFHLPETWLEVKAREYTGTPPKFPTFPRFEGGGNYPSWFSHSTSWSLWKSGDHQSFFQTRTTVLHQGLLLGLIAPACNLSFTCVLTSSSNGGAMHLNHSLKGSSSVTLMLCLTWMAHPNSLSSREKMSWYSINNSQACSAFSLGHWSRPDKSKVAISFSLHSSTLRLDFGFLGAFRDSSVPSFRWGWGTLFAVCTQATFCPFLRWIGDPIVLHKTMGTVLLPLFITV